MPTIHLNIVSADRALVNEQVDEVQIPGSEGYFGVLPGHAPLLAMLGAAERAEAIDVARAEAAKKRAEEGLAKPPIDFDYERARITLLKALTRLQVASRARMRS